MQSRCIALKLHKGNIPVWGNHVGAYDEEEMLLEEDYSPQGHNKTSSPSGEVGIIIKCEECVRRFLEKENHYHEGSESRRRGCRNDRVIVRSGIATRDHIGETENFLRILLISHFNDVDLVRRHIH
ncbi:hypothetical protein Tco_1078946 [Tanacetum coccineum]|uniref:Uncharacterized protein n=1 Tax=Tanacetum coccineum TaxID=301880 RepID=A0ABQ5HRJ5_9ASTR